MVLFFLISFASVASTDNVTITFNINGPGCNHVSVRDTTPAQNILGIYKEQDFREVVARGDDFILKQIKAFMNDNSARGLPKAAIKSILENRNFDIKVSTGT